MEGGPCGARPLQRPAPIAPRAVSRPAPRVRRGRAAGDLGEAALVAAGGLRKASPWSVVATGEAAPPAPGAEPPEAVRAASAVPYGVEPPSSPHEPASNGHADAGGIGRPDTLRWAIALGFLAIVFVGMIAALGAISSL